MLLYKICIYVTFLASGLVLLIAAIIALVVSNSVLSDYYFNTLEKYLFIGINEFGLKLSVHHWINDLLMAIFFFFVTLEIKREFIQGELSNIKKAMLPIIAAVGGMVVPALFYIVINWDNSETMNGWAIPSASVNSRSPHARHVPSASMLHGSDPNESANH